MDLSLIHIYNDRKVEVHFVNSEKLTDENVAEALKGMAGVMIGCLLYTSGKSQSCESRYAFGGASEIFDAQTEYVGADSETGYRLSLIHILIRA